MSAMQRNAVLAAVAVLGALFVWQELRIRDLEDRLQTRPTPTSEVKERVASADFEVEDDLAPRRRIRARNAPREDLVDGEVLRPLARAAREAAELAPREPATAFDDEEDSPKQIAAIVAAEVDKREEERSERRRVQMLARTEEVTRAFSAEHKLDSETTESLVSMSTAEREQIFDLFSRARGGEMDFQEAMEKVQTVRAETDENAKALLDEESFQAFQTEREEERGPWSRGRR